MKRTLAFPIYIFLICLLVCPGRPIDAAQEAGLIPRRDLFSPMSRRAIRLSPDGASVSYLATANGRTNLWIAPIASPSEARPVLTDPSVEIIGYEWSFVSGLIVLLHRTAQGTRISAFDLKTGGTRFLTPAGESVARLEKLSPDRPAEILVSLNDRNRDARDLHVINLRTGASRRVLENPGFDGFMVDNQLRPRVARRGVADGYELHARRGESWELLTSIDRASALASQPAGLDRSGRTLYMIDNLTTDSSVLKAIDLQKGTSRVLLEDPGVDLSLALLIRPRDGRVQSVTSYRERSRRHYLDKSIARDFDYLESLHDADVGIAGRSLDDRIWLVVYLDGGPPRFHGYDRRGMKTWFLFTDMDGLSGHVLADRRPVVIKSRDGLSLPGHLYFPPGTPKNGPDRPLPMLVFVHGGPSVAYPWNSWFTNRVLQLLASRGYVVFRVEFRGTGGFGKRMVERGDLEWGGKMNDDILDSVEWAVAQGIAERGRIGIFGWSYGGYATLAAMAFSPSVFACGIALYPVSDLEKLIAAGASDLIRQAWRRKLGDETTPGGKSLLAERSPINHVGRIVGPLLVTHGAQDRVVSREHSDEFVRRMNEQGKPVGYLLYPDEGHDYERSASWVSFFAVAESFLHQHLGGRYEPVGDDLAGGGFEVVSGRGLIPGLDLPRTSRR